MKMAEDADNAYFKKLLSMVPAQFYFIEDKKAAQSTEDSEMVSLAEDADSATDEKIKGKKKSKQKKKKKKEKAKTGPKINVQEAQEKLRARIAELQAKRLQNHSLTTAEAQERKRLERKQRSLKMKRKQENKREGGSFRQESSASVPENVPIVKTGTKPIRNSEGKLVFSKFDFRQSGQKEKKSDLVGKDFTRILARLEQRDAKVAKLKETDKEAASRLEQRHVWQDVLTKARGEKIKDDVSKVKKAIKRKEKVQEQRQKKWQDRKATEDKMKKQRQEKRQENIQKRKDDKKAKHRKKLIKKGRILPGF